MKKKLFVSLLLALSLLLSLAVCARAEAQLDYVSDYAGILSDVDRNFLSSLAEQYAEDYDCGVYVVVIGDYTQYVNGGIEDFAEEVFHSYGLGRGESEDGVILAMSMDQRDYDIYAHGDFGNYAFTDYGKERLAESFLDNFRRDDWAGGFQDFIVNSGELMRRARSGDPVDQWISDPAEQGPRFSFGKLLIGLMMGCLVGGTTVSGMKRQMKTAVRQTRAADYVSQGGVNLRGQRDDFVNRTVTRQPIPKQTTSSRSGGHYRGTSISGHHGGSHHSGKF